MASAQKLRVAVSMDGLLPELIKALGTLAESQSRIEAKLDALCEALAAEDAEGDDQPMKTLDGRTVRSTGTAGEPM